MKATLRKADYSHRALAYFNVRTLRALRLLKIEVLGMTYVPDGHGSFLNGEEVVSLDFDGCGCLRPYLDVLAYAKGTKVLTV